ncbi:hypothetical protein G6F70_004022 [Rhizopus microsporus]|nr:hypothetical protein G6F71_003298 [Rhizopus microsporus]KAG1200476.1 hypothetical protein G6F70_004022 [Rhizopus microsporus]
MPKQRPPISSRLRSRDKSTSRTSADSATRKEEQREVKTVSESSFSPRHDINIYLDELHNPLSFVRGTSREKDLEDESDSIVHTFGHPGVRLSTFYKANVAPPIQSKRTDHLHSKTEIPQVRPLPASFIISKRQKTYKKKAEKRYSSPSSSPILPASSSSATPSPISLNTPSSASVSPQPPQALLEEKKPPVPVESSPKPERKRPKYSRRKRELKLLQLDSKIVLPPPDTPRASKLRSNTPVTRERAGKATAVKQEPKERKTTISKPKRSRVDNKEDKGKLKKKATKSLRKTKTVKEPTPSPSSSTSSTSSTYDDDSSDDSYSSDSGSSSTASFTTDESDSSVESYSSYTSSSSGEEDFDKEPSPTFKKKESYSSKEPNTRTKTSTNKTNTHSKTPSITKRAAQNSDSDAPRLEKDMSHRSLFSSTRKLPSIKQLKIASKRTPIKKVTFSCPVVADYLPKRRKIVQSPAVYKPSHIPLPLSATIPLDTVMDAKEKEEEYERRQFRLFVHSRYISNEEAALVAMTVYSDKSIGPADRLVMLLQNNFSRFRRKLKRIFDDLSRLISISKKEMIKDERRMKVQISNQMTDEVLRSIWEYWIDEPYINAGEFFESMACVSLLKEVTVQAVICHYKEKYRIYTTEEAFEEMKRLDRITRALQLPEYVENSSNNHDA